MYLRFWATQYINSYIALVWRTCEELYTCEELLNMEVTAISLRGGAIVYYVLQRIVTQSVGCEWQWAAGENPLLASLGGTGSPCADADNLVVGGGGTWVCVWKAQGKTIQNTHLQGKLFVHQTRKQTINVIIFYKIKRWCICLFSQEKPLNSVDVYMHSRRQLINLHVSGFQLRTDCYLEQITV